MKDQVRVECDICDTRVFDPWSHYRNVHGLEYHFINPRGKNTPSTLCECATPSPGVQGQCNLCGRLIRLYAWVNDERPNIP